MGDVFYIQDRVQYQQDIFDRLFDQMYYAHGYRDACSFYIGQEGNYRRHYIFFMYASEIINIVSITFLGLDSRIRYILSHGTLKQGEYLQLVGTYGSSKVKNDIYNSIIRITEPFYRDVTYPDIEIINERVNKESVYNNNNNSQDRFDWGLI
jgi:hypothetical protein